MTSADAAAEPGGVQAFPRSFLGQPLSTWLFALRTWAAMVAALLAAFWLQLDDPSSSAVTVAILSLPTRGQAMEKAFFRIGATLVGFLASIAITGLFAQSRDLFVVAAALWIATGVYAASLYDGTRAYGFVLSGYTVAIISLLHIDSPQSVFDYGMARVAVVTLGIVSVAFIGDAFAAPELWSSVRSRMRKVAAEIEEASESLSHGAPTRPERLATLLSTMVGLRLDVLALPSERAEGWRQASAGSSALAAMVMALSASRVLSLMRRIEPDAELDAIIDRLDDPSALASAMEAALATRDRRRIAMARYAADFAEQRDLFRRELAAMEAGRRAERPISLPIHRERKEAARKALRVLLAILVAAPFFVLSSWPFTYLAFGQFSILAALSATQPNAKAFGRGAMIAMPLAVAVAGITEFIILDGVDSFPLLAIGMAPAVTLACFLMVNKSTAGIGFLMLVYFPVILSPSNPQSYNPQSYVQSGILTITAGFAVAIALNCFVPTTDKDRRRWMVERLRDDLLAAVDGRKRFDPAAAVWLAVDRLVQVSNFAIGCPKARERRLRYMLLLCHLIRAANAAQNALDLIEGCEWARAALATLCARDIADAADRLAEQATDAQEPSRGAHLRAVAAMSFISDALTTRATDLRHLRLVLER